MPLSQRTIGGRGVFTPSLEYGYEDEDAYGAPSIDDEAEFQKLQAESPTGSAPERSKPVHPLRSLDRMTQAGAMQEAHEKARPNVSDFKPKGWQRALAGLTAGAAGYVNAGGRVKVDPQAVQNITGSLMRPGYRGAMEKWQDQGVEAEAEMRGATRDYQIESAQQKAGIDDRRATAYEEAQGSTRALNEKRAKKLDEEEWSISPRGTHMYNRKGEYKALDGIPAPAPPRETPSEATARKAKEAVEVLGMQAGTDDFKAYMGDKAALERIRAKNRPAKAGRGAAKEKRGTLGQFSGVEDKKQARLKIAEDAHLKRVEKDSAKYDESLRILEADKQRIMDGYDAGVESLGGSVVPRTAAPAAPQPAAPAASPAAAAPKMTEAQVRQRAIAAGKDPEAVIKIARERGLL